MLIARFLTIKFCLFVFRGFDRVQECRPDVLKKNSRGTKKFFPGIKPAEGQSLLWVIDID